MDSLKKKTLLYSQHQKSIKDLLKLFGCLEPFTTSLRLEETVKRNGLMCFICNGERVLNLHRNPDLIIRLLLIEL